MGGRFAAAAPYRLTLPSSIGRPKGRAGACSAATPTFWSGEAGRRLAPWGQDAIIPCALEFSTGRRSRLGRTGRRGAGPTERTGREPQEGQRRTSCEGWCPKAGKPSRGLPSRLDGQALAEIPHVLIGLGATVDFLHPFIEGQSASPTKLISPFQRLSRFGSSSRPVPLSTLPTRRVQKSTSGARRTP